MKTTLRFGSLSITGDLEFAEYGSGNVAVMLMTDEGREHVSLNLLPYGHPTLEGEFYVKNSYEGLAQSLVEAGIAEIVEESVNYGGFDSTAARMRLVEPESDDCGGCGTCERCAPDMDLYLSGSGELYHDDSYVDYLNRH